MRIFYVRYHTQTEIMADDFHYLVIWTMAELSSGFMFVQVVTICVGFPQLQVPLNITPLQLLFFLDCSSFDCEDVAAGFSLCRAGKAALL